MLYPSFPEQTSFSTNHLEPGTHIGSSLPQQTTFQNRSASGNVNNTVTHDPIRSIPNMSKTGDPYHRAKDYTVPLLLGSFDNVIDVAEQSLNGIPPKYVAVNLYVTRASLCDSEDLLLSIFICYALSWALFIFFPSSKTHMHTLCSCKRIEWNRNLMIRSINDSLFSPSTASPNDLPILDILLHHATLSELQQRARVLSNIAYGCSTRLDFDRSGHYLCVQN